MWDDSPGLIFFQGTGNSQTLLCSIFFSDQRFSFFFLPWEQRLDGALISNILTMGNCVKHCSLFTCGFTMSYGVHHCAKGFHGFSRYLRIRVTLGTEPYSCFSALTSTRKHLRQKLISSY